MRAQPVAASQNRRIVASLPFVEALARRMAASMPNSIDIGDLVQDGVLGLIDAAHRFDEGRGIKFETFAERRIRGAMIDALRRDAWPRGVRRQRRELEAARETLRRELGHEPSIADLAAKVGTDEKRLGRTIVRIATIESTSPLATSGRDDRAEECRAGVPPEARDGEGTVDDDRGPCGGSCGDCREGDRGGGVVQIAGHANQDNAENIYRAQDAGSPCRRRRSTIA